MEITENKEYIITIDSVSSDGSGVGHINGLTVFIPLAVTGDTVQVIITRLKKHYAYGRIIKIIKPSSWRTAEKCPHSEKCGGCQLSHINYDCQLKIKKEIIENSMRRIGGFDKFHLDGIAGMDTPYHYRNKTIFKIGNKDENNNICGFYERKSHNIVPIEDCIIGSKLNRTINKAVIDYMNNCNVSAYNEKTHKGTIRHIFTRVSFSADEIMVVISANAYTLPNKDYLIANLKNISNKITGVILNVNTKKNTPLLGKKNIVLWGKGTITDTICGIKFYISPESFFQINPIQTEKLYNKAIEYANITHDMTVMDIYCGIGTISLCAAKYAKKVIGIEIVEKAISDAKKNAELNNIKNTEFYADSAENIVPELLEQNIKPDIVILDPPRKGSDETTLSAIIKAQPKRIVYISCNSATLARDSRYIADSGYTISKAHGFDLFPHTIHAETIILFKK
ncbi:MAG: 23S rRNA (uracil(1939)-C(5))-methyltransferase RlmD [Clostridia bacterium]|nr:23S rRNA (uracil(1939)-C(5))-methyltransferase RlmD [Clostridia bacterium]